MTLPSDLELIRAAPAVVLGIVAVAVTVWFTARAVRYLITDKQTRPALRASWRIRRTWARTARRVGLVQSERSSPQWWSTRPAPTTLVTRALVPSVTVRAERWGVRVDAATFGRLGLAEFTAAGPHLADAWRVPIVRVAQLRPGVIRIRALLHDPLTEPTQWTDTEAIGDPAVWLAGVDADGQPVTIRSAGVSGVVVAGLAGYGKTSFLNHRFCQLAANPAVQFVLIDGKGGPDYDDLFARAWLWAKDDPQTVRDHLERVHALMVARQHAIRAVLGVKNIWHVGATAGWPLTVVVIDEAHTFLNETRGTDAESKRLDALARQTARLVEELIRKGRNVGVQVILATQKATGDAIPTRIRDNCQVAVSFAQRTSEAATAALGSDITNSPDEHPRRLQEAGYVGVASMVVEGRSGFTLVRTPYVPDHLADQIARRTAHLVRDPHELLNQSLSHSVAGNGDACGSQGGGGSFRQEPTAAAPGVSPNHLLDEGPLDDATP